MEEKQERVLQHLSDINIKKNKIREGLTLSRQTYASYRQKQKIVIAYRISLATIGMAAAVLLGFVFIPSLVSLDPQMVFEENYQRFAFDTRDRGTDPSDRLTNSAELYMKGQQKEALLLLDSAGYSNSDKLRAQFIKGLAELDWGNDESAKMVLKEVADSGGVMGNAAGWYLSLLCLKERDYKEARNWLQVVKEYKGSPYAARASKLFHQVRFRATR